MDTGEVATVYNVAVTGNRTYFVGSPAWGFAVWAHNTDICWRAVQETIERALGRATGLERAHLGDIANAVNLGNDAGRAAAERLLTRPGSGITAAQAAEIVENLAGRRIGAAPRWAASVAENPQTAAQLLARDCVADARAIQQEVGGQIMRIENPLGAAAGPANVGTVRPPGGGTISGAPGSGGWRFHEAVVRDGRVYDAMTGPQGMALADYQRLFQDWDALRVTLR